MATVNELVNKFCSQNQFSPSHKDFCLIGHEISTHFRNEWGLNNLDCIDDAGFVPLTENGRTFLASYYPERFADQMTLIIGEFYVKKKNRIERAELSQKQPENPKKEISAEPKKRTRKPVQKPAFSLKK